MPTLKLTRDQLASFLQDHEQIKQFERLFSVADQVSVNPDTQGITIQSGSAEAKAASVAADLDYSVSQLEVNDSTQEARINALIGRVEELTHAVQGLMLAPPPKTFERSRYGSFYDTTTQTPAAINTAYPITFDSTSLSSGVYIGGTTSRIYVDTAGIYNYDISFQLDKTSGGVGLFYIWFRVNGTDVADSASQIRVQGNDAEIFTSLNFFFDLAAGDYVEVVYAADTTSIQLLAEAATALHPGIPSIILTVSNNIGGIHS